MVMKGRVVLPVIVSILILGMISENVLQNAYAASFVGLGDLPGGIFSSAGRGVSSDGTVAGAGQSASGSEAFRWTSGGGMVGLGDLPGGAFNSIASDVSSDGSVVVGNADSASGGEAFRWTSGGGMVGLGDLPGGVFSSEGFGMSSDGSVVVGSGISASGFEAFRWTSGGGMVGLGDLPGGIFSSTAFDVSSDGSVVVGNSDDATGSRAMIWDSVNGIRDLNTVLTNLGVDLTGYTLTFAGGVSADGTKITGNALGPSGTEAFFADLSTAQVAVGGTFLPIDTTSLLLAGAYTTASWVIPVLVVAAGFGIAIFTLKKNH